MAKHHILAAAPEQKVHLALEELLQHNAIESNAVLVSTKNYRHPSVEQFVDIQKSSFDENVLLDIAPEDTVTLIQFNHTLISFVNVYRCLRANGVTSFTIKVVGSEPIRTSIARVFDSFSNVSAEQDDSVLWISPNDIKLRHEFPQTFHGQTVGGDWDTSAEDFCDSVLFYKSLEQRVKSKTDWTLTSYYQDVIASITDGKTRFGCNNIDAFNAHCEKIDLIYQDMKENGWKQQENSDYVTINIGRNGQVLFNDGRHRVSMAKLLGIKKIPVKIAVRHSKWVEFKNEIKAFADKFYDGQVYAKINHVDLNNIGFSQEDERLNVISQNITLGNKSVLDIGSHWGYFCSGLEELGYSCTAVEADVTNFYFLNKLKIAANKKFLAQSASVFDFINKKSKYDVVLALNIFHHFIKTEEKHQQFIALLNNLDMQEMFLQTHSPEEPQMKGSFRNYPALEFAEFVVNNSCLNTIDLLVEYKNGRKLYKLSR